MPNITTNHAITYTNTNVPQEGQESSRGWPARGRFYISLCNQNSLWMCLRLFPCDFTIEFVITGANSGNSIAKQIP